jgi:hypothetical protein
VLGSTCVGESKDAGTTVPSRGRVKIHQNFICDRCPRKVTFTSRVSGARNGRVFILYMENYNKEDDYFITLDYLHKTNSLCTDFPVVLNHKTPTHLFLDLYSRVDDLMKVSCNIFYEKEFGSFKVRKEKLEKKWENL